MLNIVVFHRTFVFGSPKWKVSSHLRYDRICVNPFRQSAMVGRSKINCLRIQSSQIHLIDRQIPIFLQVIGDVIQVHHVPLELQ